MDPQERVIRSVNASVNLIGTDRFAALAINFAKVLGKEISGHVQPHDTPGLFMPVEMEYEGKGRQAAILVLADRAIVVWATGTFRLKTFTAVIPLSSIFDVVESTRPEWTLSVERPVVILKAERDWELIHHNLYEGGANGPDLLGGFLCGGITFDGEDEGSEARNPVEGQLAEAPRLAMYEGNEHIESDLVASLASRGERDRVT